MRKMRDIAATKAKLLATIAPLRILQITMIQIKLRYFTVVHKNNGTIEIDDIPPTVSVISHLLGI